MVLKEYMTERIDISVIVVTYNQENTISRTLESILSQVTDARFEIVIGDDNSTDSTSEICRKYAESYPGIIKYHHRDRNLGLVANYYRCIEECRGKYIADCAGDDFWVDRGKLQKEFMELENDPEVSLVHTGWMSCDIDGKNVRLPESFDAIGREKRLVYGKGELPAGLLRGDKEVMIHLCTAMYRRDVIIRELEREPELYVSADYSCEDLQIMIAMAAFGKVVFLPDITLHYSVADCSISHQPDFTKKFRQVKGTLILTERLRKHYGISEKELHDYYATTLDYLCAQAFHSGEKKLFGDYLAVKDTLPPGSGVETKTRIREMMMRSATVWRMMRRLIGKDKSL